jgi:hypothetical protein
VQSVQGVSSGTAVGVSTSSLPLPTGAATSELQTSGNSTLTTINTTLGSPIQNSGSSVTFNGATNVTMNDCSGTIVTGGTSQVAISAQTMLHGYIIKNIDSTTGPPGGAGEFLYVSPTETAAAARQTSGPLLPQGTPGLPGSPETIYSTGAADNMLNKHTSYSPTQRLPVSPAKPKGKWPNADTRSYSTMGRSAKATQPMGTRNNNMTEHVVRLRDCDEQ